MYMDTHIYMFYVAFMYLLRILIPFIGQTCKSVEALSFNKKSMQTLENMVVIGGQMTGK